MRVLTLFALAGGVSLGVLAGDGFAGASGTNVGTRARASTPAATTTASESNPGANKCGCYEDSAGSCHCAKKSQCGCPGECEPSGCEQKREKEFAKEAQDELKRQQQEDKKRNAELARKQEELDKKDAEKRERGSLRGLRLIEQK
jgi:hypothetical protein